MPLVSSVLEKCVVGKEGGNESQPVGGLCEGHRTRRAEIKLRLDTQRRYLSWSLMHKLCTLHNLAVVQIGIKVLPHG